MQKSLLRKVFLVLSVFSLLISQIGIVIADAPAAGLVAYWKMDETSGLTAADSSGNGHPAAFSGGASFVAGKVNNALSQDGTTAVGSIANPVSVGSTHTIAMWVKPSSGGGDYAGLLMSGCCGGIMWRPSLSKFFYQGSGGSFLNNTAITQNQWVHVAIVSDGTTATFYINGVADGSGPASASFSFDSFSRTTSWYQGYEDEVRVYNRALSAQEILNVYNDTGTGTVPPPDTTPPVISNIASASISSSSALINWTTDENSDTQVDYGTTSSYGQSSTLDSSLTTSHSAPLSSLNPSTVYHFRVKSRDAAGNLAVSSDQSFTTASGSGGSSPVISSFTASPSSITSGGSTTLSWTASGAVSLSIDNGIGTVTGTSKTVTPAITTTYTLTATNSSGSVTSQTTVSVGSSSGIVLQAGPGQTVSMTGDISLTGQSIELIGTASSPCTLEGNGHSITTTGNSYVDHITIKYCTVHNLGTSARNALDYIYVPNSGYIDIENTTWDASGGMYILSYGNSTMNFSNNTVLANSLVPEGSSASNPIINTIGDSVGAKIFKSNKIYKGYVTLNSTNWQVGGTTNAEGNIIIGVRGGMNIGANSVVQHNYVHALFPVDPNTYPFFSQLNTFSLGAGSQAKDNVIREGEWVVQSVDGEFANNVVLEQNSHNFLRFGSGNVHNNIFSQIYLGAPFYQQLSPIPGDVAIWAQAGMRFTNNTIDASGDRGGLMEGMEVHNGDSMASLRNNVFYNFAPTAGRSVVGCGHLEYGTTDCTASNTGTRLVYADYNSFYYDPSAGSKDNYAIGVIGKTECQAGFAMHDLGGCPNGNVNPKFKGPIPIGSPFKDSDIIAGNVTVQNILDYYRYVYSPGAGSPLLNAQDPQDGAGDIGAVQSATVVPVTISNKAPIPDAGIDYSINLGDTAYLDGWSTDDALPNNTLTQSWTMVSGPGTVTFGNASKGLTTAQFSAAGSYTLRLTASDGALSASDDVVITVGGSGSSGLPSISSFTASPSSITSGGSTTLSWTASGAVSLSIDNGIGTVTGTSKTVTPAITTTYTLTATNSSGSVTSQTTVTVGGVTGSPVISSFTASPASISSGSSAVLSWTASGAASLSIDNGVGTVTGTSKSVSPTQTTTYTLTATNSSGSVTAQTTVTVTMPAGTQKPTGSFDGIDTTAAKIFGWAQDPDNTSVPVTVHIYIDKNAGTTGASPIAITASDFRSDVGNHAFNYIIPTQYWDNAPHQVWVWAIDLTDTSGASNVQLTGSPKSFTLAPPPPGTLNPHPRIFLDSQMLSLLTNKKNTNDPDWVTIKAAADNILTEQINNLTITGATNASPATFTTAQALPWTGTARIYLGGGTGAWAGVNLPGGVESDYATAVGPNSFTLTNSDGTPFNSSSFGSYAGQNIKIFILNGENIGNNLTYGQTGSGWYDAFLQLGLVYKLTGDATYANKALQLLDYINSLGAAGMNSPVSQDGGRASMGATFGLAIAYDWYYNLLSAAQKTATYNTLNLWDNWTIANGYALHDPTSNYWEAHQTAVAATGYATMGENPSAQTWIDWADNHWQTDFVSRVFAPPTPGMNPSGSNDPTSLFYSGYTSIGYNYGGNDIARHIKYMIMVKTATGRDIFSTTDYAQRWAKALIYQVKPSHWQAVTQGQWTGYWYGLLTKTGALALSYALAGKPEGGWAQQIYQTNGTPPPGTDTFIQPNYEDKFMFYNPNAPTVDYRTTEPAYYFADSAEPYVHWRSDWSDTGDYTWISAAGSHFTGSTPKDGGHIDITRGNDYLMPMSDQWKGTTDGSNGSPELSWLSAAYSSTLYFWDGGSAAGGKCFNQDYSYDGCQTGFGKYQQPLVKLANNYAFVQNDFATGYDYSQIPSQRTLQYYIRSYMPMGNGIYVVWDRIQSTSATHTKQLRWQMPGTTPTAANGIITTSIGSSKMFINTLLPANPTINLVRNTDANGNPANWHAEVTDPVPAKNYNGLTVIYTGDTNLTMPATNLIASIDANHAGVEVNGSSPKVAVMAKNATANADGSYNPATYNSASFTTTHNGTAAYLISGLVPGTYDVYKNSIKQVSVSVGQDTTAYYTGAAGNYSLVQTGTSLPLLPTISTFTASPSAITAGGSSVLSFSVSNATSLSIDNGVGSVTGLASKSISPAVTTTYTLTATNSSGSVTSPVTVTVNLAPDTTSPTANISSPSAGTVSGTITATVSASDPVVSGQVTSGLKLVSFLIDGSVFATSTSGSITTTLDTTTLTNASHSMTATALDNAGNSFTTAPVVITVNNTLATKYPRTIQLTSLEGLTALPANQSITVSVLSPSSGAVLETQSLTPTAGKYTVAFLASDPQIVNLRIKAAGYLSQLLSNIDTTLNSATALTVPQLSAGDFNNDNTVNSLDYSLLNNNWLKAGAGDINGDSLINTLDFAILKNNYGKAGQ